jgi:hypothetical protein
MFGKEAPLTIRQGALHEYLGMFLDYTSPGSITIRMDDYIASILSELPYDMEGESLTPAGNHLFDINKQPGEILLDQTAAEMFHTNVAKLWHLCNQARPICK